MYAVAGSHYWPCEAKYLREIFARLCSENTTSSPLNERALSSWLGSGTKTTTQGSSEVVSTADQRVTTKLMQTESEVKNPLKHQGANVGTTDTAVNARIVDKVPKTDCKYPTGDGDNAGSGGMDLVGEE